MAMGDAGGRGMASAPALAARPTEGVGIGGVKRKLGGAGGEREAARGGVDARQGMGGRGQVARWAQRVAATPAAGEARRHCAPRLGSATTREQQEDEAAERMRRGGLGGGLGAEVDSSGAGETQMMATLRESMRRRVMATWNIGHINTALGWWEDFLVGTGRVPFRELRWAGDLQASVYNNETLDAFAVFIRMTGPKRARGAGEELTARYIQSMVTTIRLLRSGEARYDVAPAEAGEAARRRLAYKSMRAEDGPMGDRRSSRGFRAADFEAIADRMVRSSRRGMLEWAVGLGAHAMLLRGGEVGTVTGKAADASRIITIASVTPRAPCYESRWLPWMTVDVVSIKDTAVAHKPVPVPIRKRRSAEGPDPLCAYSAVMALHCVRCREVPACPGPCTWCHRQAGTRKPAGRPPVGCARANAPLFTGSDGKVLDTKAINGIAKRMASLAGIPAEAVSARLWRVGGATDLRATLGMAGADMIKERGRWGSDVAFIYARALASQQMDAAAGMAAATGREVEAMVPGWVQPA